MNRLDLDGRRAIVTGAAAGLGLAMAKRIAESGARVALWDRDEAALARAADEIGRSAETVVVDVADPAAISTGVEESLKRLGGIDVLVNNAGISGPNTVTWEYPVEDWRRGTRSPPLITLQAGWRGAAALCGPLPADR
jgi:2-dehydro-3-deoxy-L-rhamnonate dehydrogenase (NAD+)